jgi:outer membrane protein OmpA-like peptidoglycan-associated protein
MDFFVEANGEFRVEKGSYPRDPGYDPFTLTPGFRFHLPANVDIALGLDVGIRALSNFTWKYKDEMHAAEAYQLYYTDKNGKKVQYGYTPTPRYAGSAAIVWRFGNVRGADEDNDGVANNIDQCAGTPAGAVVDANGCPVDGDNDGVFDGLDQCAETPAGAVVDAAGCPVDSDKDGVADYLDKCPSTPAGATIDANGCPIDSDKDGVADYLDQCPNTQSGIAVDGKGCPVDSDNDGVADYLDKCPSTPAGLPVNADGCSPDTDKDGIVDALDKCPNTPAGVSVDEVGCPVDSDKDGVADHLDKCPNTLVGVAVDKNGCPNKNQDLDKLKKGIQFKSGSAKLTASSNKTLNNIAKLLKKLPAVNLEVQGHTDDTGKEEKNKKISEQRAQAVVKYLVKKGIDSERLRAVGYGSDKPIADNKTKKGRKLNRRVELVPFEK